MKNIKKFIKINILTKKLKNINKNQKKCFVFMAANYGNLGDVAITYAQKLFLEENLKGYTIIEVYIEDVYPLYRSIKKNINNNDIITLIGGGNTGDLYIDFEEKRRFIYKNFKENKIISFPQSIFFSNTKSGNKELEKSKKVYNDNKNLVIFARESKSYELYKKYFNANVRLVPDIVLSLKEKNNIKRNGITVCLRNDKEKDINNNLSGQILNFLNSRSFNVKYADTHIGNVKINVNEREKILKKFLEKISSSQIVVTDRLHGMIFCAITATPCIVLSNNNHKVFYTYENWLKDLEYIHFIDKNDDILKVKMIINKYLNSNKNYNTRSFYNEFKPLRKELKNEK